LDSGYKVPMECNGAIPRLDSNLIQVA